MADGTRRATAKEVVAAAAAGVSSSGMLLGLAFASSGVAAPLTASSWLGFGVEVVAGLGAAVQRTVVVLMVGAAAGR